MEIQFEILKPKKDFKLEIPFGTTFSRISEMVFEHFGLERSDYPDDQKSGLKFIHKQIRCRENRTIESYDITSQSKVYVSVPKQLYSKFSEIKSNVKPRQSSEIPLPFSLDKSQLPPVNEEVAYRNIMSVLDTNSLRQIVECGYDEKSAAYALVYFEDPQSAFDFLVPKISDDPEYRYLINAIYMKWLPANELCKYDFMLSFVIAKYLKENPYVRAAVCIQFYLIYLASIGDQTNLFKLNDFCSRVEQKYPGQIHRMTSEYYAKGKRPMICYKTGMKSNASSNVSRVTKKFHNLCVALAGSTPDNYKNPFVETYEDYLSICPNSPSIKLIDYGRTLNYEQLMFVYRNVLLSHKKVNDVVEMLMVCQGDTEKAQKLLYSD